MSKIDLSPEALQECGEIAEKATQGNWYHTLDYDLEDVIYCVNGYNEEQICKLLGSEYRKENNALYIQKFAPEFVLAMIDEIKRLRNEFDNCKLQAAHWQQQYEMLQECVAKLEAENEYHKQFIASHDIFFNAVIHHCKENWDSALIKHIEQLTEDNKQLDEAYKSVRAILDKENMELRAKVKQLEAEADWLAKRLVDDCLGIENCESLCDNNNPRCHQGVDYIDWRTAAREAVANQCKE